MFSAERPAKAQIIFSSIAGPHHFDIDPDPDPALVPDPDRTFQSDADPTFQSDADPDPTFQLNSVPNPTTHFFPDLDPPVFKNDTLKVSTFLI
jgi:hypothetical protein